MSVISSHRSLSFSRLVLWRCLREQRRLLVVGPVMTLVAVALVSAVCYLAPGLLTGFSATGLHKAAFEVLQMSPNDRSAMLSAFLAVQAPYFLMSVLGLMAAGFAKGILTGDLERGAIELYLANGLSIRQIALGNLYAIVVLSLGMAAMTAFAWLACLVLFSGMVDLGVIWSHIHPGALLMLLVSTTALSTLISLLLCLVFPRLSGVTAGFSMSPAQTLAGLPAIAVAIGVTAFPHISAYASYVSVIFFAAALVLGLVLLNRFFDASSYIKS